MPVPVVSVVLAFAGLLSFSLGAVFAYRARNRDQSVPGGAAVLLVFGIIVLFGLAAISYEGTKADYTVYQCNESWYGTSGDAQSFESLSPDGKDVFQKTLSMDGTYRVHRQPPDFSYVTDAISGNAIRYQGTCYSLLAKEGGLQIGLLLILPPTALFASLAVIVGINGIRSGEHTFHTTALLAGIATWLVITVFILRASRGALAVGAGVGLLTVTALEIGRLAPRIYRKFATSSG